MEELGSKLTDRPPDSGGPAVKYVGELEEDAPCFDSCLRDFDNVGDGVEESGGGKVEWEAADAIYKSMRLLKAWSIMEP